MARHVYYAYQNRFHFLKYQIDGVNTAVSVKAHVKLLTSHALLYIERNILITRIHAVTSRQVTHNYHFSSAIEELVRLCDVSCSSMLICNPRIEACYFFLMFSWYRCQHFRYGIVK